MSSSPPKLLARVRAVMRARHLSPRTEQAYLAWIRRYVSYCGMRHPETLGDQEVVAFLTDLADRQQVARSTQVQALSALSRGASPTAWRHPSRHPFDDTDALAGGVDPAGGRWALGAAHR
jgi:hypothetical protein